jgi:predicted house-cleaning NTP pyrophosphatase (Maf/HAM1 superfamily)
MADTLAPLSGGLLHKPAQIKRHLQASMLPLSGRRQGNVNTHCALYKLTKCTTTNNLQQ